MAALLVIPLVLVVVLMTPAWLAWPFLSNDRRKDVCAVVGQFVDWIRVVAGSTQSLPPRAEDTARLP
jgi:hypothetical protein